ncbi:MAG TPA: hypothetical protein VGF88_20120 [Acidobacteriaceae bacterium]|jgi:hypothetical protein
MTARSPVPLGAPVGPKQFTNNLIQIFTERLGEFPAAVIVVHRPIWYSPNTHNHSDYEQPGLDRLQTYFPAIDAAVSAFARTNPGHIYLGDADAFARFSTHYQNGDEPGTWRRWNVLSAPQPNRSKSARILLGLRHEQSGMGWL